MALYRPLAVEVIAEWYNTEDELRAILLEFSVLLNGRPLGYLRLKSPSI